MKRTLIHLLISSCLITAGSLNTIAQDKKPPADEGKAPIDGTFKILAPKVAFGKMVKGAPYSATATTETIQTLIDGNQIIRKNQSKIFRDSEGRTRTEQTLETIGKWTADGEASQSIFINDPIAGASYSLDTRSRIAYKNAYPQKKVMVEPGKIIVSQSELEEKIATKKAAAGAQSETILVNGEKVSTYKINGKEVSQSEFEAFTSEMKKMKAEDALAKRPLKVGPIDPDMKKKIEGMSMGKVDAGERKTVSLGAQTIEGVSAEGSSTTTTIPAGEIGNTLPIEVIDESWYSPELQITVMTKHSDPRTGATTYRLTNISRNEPDRSLFEIPADYTVKENNMPFPRKPSKKEE